MLEVLVARRRERQQMPQGALELVGLQQLAQLARQLGCKLQQRPVLVSQLTGHRDLAIVVLRAELDGPLTEVAEVVGQLAVDALP
jgi:hypothetical protein